MSVAMLSFDFRLRVLPCRRGDTVQRARPERQAGDRAFSERDAVGTLAG